jgi:hypothetical protein
MTPEFFKQEIKRLEANYGTGTYGNETIKAIWERVSHVKPERFRRALDYCLAENPKYAFGIDKIEVALSYIREEKHQEEKQERNNKAPSLEEIRSAVGEMLKDLNAR